MVTPLWAIAIALWTMIALVVAGIAVGMIRLTWDKPEDLGQFIDARIDARRRYRASHNDDRADGWKGHPE
ncbi:MAG TPA: hypothetical protein VH374_26390 [Polyangia bacterium]|jgi:hypothetical protein|nr:hypothetical protein [Polyangia bacterium]